MAASAAAVAGKPEHIALRIVADSGHTAHNKAPSTPSDGSDFSEAREGMQITLRGLTYSVPSNTVKGERAVLLNNVNGFFQSGQMTALIGPSGSGKTTLLDIVSGRRASGRTEGEVLFSGQKASQAFLRRFTGYVEQFDTLISTLTVEEMLTYTAELKRKRTEPLVVKRAAVERLLEQLALVSCRDVKIGDPLAKGISGGQAKRTNIGIALVTNPRVLFLDEPTSGLDSYTANEVMSVVKGLVNGGVTIVATIHSPTAYAFGLFDRLLMLARGNMAYFGAPGEPMIKYIQTHMSTVTERALSTSYANDAEWLVDVVTEADRNGQSKALAEAYERSALHQENLAALEQVASQNLELSPAMQAELSVKKETVTPWWHALKTLTKYRSTKNFKDPNFMGARTMDKLIVGLLVLTLYWGIGDNFAQYNVSNITSVLFMWVTLPAFGAASYMPQIMLERGLFVRERSDGLYRPITYLLHKLADEMAVGGIISLIVASFVFYGLHLQNSFLLFWLIYWSTLSCGIAVAYFIASIAPNQDVANAMLPTYVVTLLYFAGLLLRYEDMPVWWAWYSWTDFLRYSWGSLMKNQFQHNDPAYLNDQTLLEYFGVKDINQWGYLGATMGFFVLFFMFAWAGMTFRRYSK